MRVIVEVELTRTSGPAQHIDLVRDGVQDALRDGIEAAESGYDVKVLTLTRRAGLPTPAVTVSKTHPATSREMARRVDGPRLQDQIIGALAAAPLTDDGLEERLGRSHQSVSAARRGLVKARLVSARLDHGRVVVRATRSGNPAQVWELTPAGMALAVERGLTPWTRSA